MGWFNTNKVYPEFYKNYLNTFKEKTKTLEDVRFVVFDTETTGLDSKSDRILSIGTVVVKNFQIDVADSLECYLEQDSFNSETVEIHGLLKKGAFYKISEKDAVVKFLDHIGNSILVAHHVAFDVAMINEALARLELPKLKNKMLDTGRLYKKTKYLKDHEHYSLDRLCELFQLTMHDRHTASGDAYLTALIFLKITALLRKKKKRLKLRDLFDWF